MPFIAIAKMLMYGRRNPDEQQKEQAATVSEVLAKVMCKHLSEYKEGTSCVIRVKDSPLTPIAGNPSTSYAYHTVMLGLITVLLFDGMLCWASNSRANNIHP